MINVFEKIINEFKLQNNTSLDDLNELNVAYAVFSCEPFGFEFPSKDILKKLSSRSLSKKYYLMSEAKKYLDNLQSNLSEEPIDVFFEKSELTQEKFAPWLCIVHTLSDMQSIIESYMREYNIGWECSEIKRDDSIIFIVYLWIQLESEARYARKNLYKVKKGKKRDRE